MDEDDWRVLALEARRLVYRLIADASAARDSAAALDRALDLPPGTAKAALRRALTAQDDLRAWVREQRARHRPDDLSDYRSTEPGPVRRLEAVLPRQSVVVDQRFPLYVRVLATSPTGPSAALKPFDVPPEGATVTVSVSAPGLFSRDDLEQELVVPGTGDSEPARFGFRALEAGLHRVLVRAHHGGTFLGELTVEVAVVTSAADKSAPGGEAVVTADLPVMVCEPGEVTLEVAREADHYRFRLLGDDLARAERSALPSADPTEAVGLLVTELGLMARGEHRLDSPALVQERLKDLGSGLWGIIPAAVRTAFWNQLDRITSFTVASELETIPWELLYAGDETDEVGFLAGRMAVVRRASGQSRARLIVPSSTAFVRSRKVPEHAGREIVAVRAHLSGTRDLGVVEDLDDLRRLLLPEPPGVLHFACHHTFDERTGAAVELNGGDFRPDTLNRAALRRAWHNSPLVFFNGCRTGGEIRALTGTVGWAGKFLRAGAGAFVGSLWDVRSTSAADFADAFYRALADGTPLGEASLGARRAIMDEAGDPTWLAYTVYGNPSARLAGR
ncbi:CHAT domain-containing protein [Streptomyces phaeochromogenes]|uniref:CHAT domain-containing protein n=1 Tax=Streptomyces phaeochromogenes TaxID=1923 RepID=UPI0033FEA55B